jgi:hypothetical protein
MSLMEESPIHGSVVAVGCGLGKTLITLLQTLVTARKIARALEEDPNCGLTQAATLVLCPGPSIEVWQADVEKFFPGIFTIHQFYGTVYSVKNAARRKTLINPPTYANLNSILGDLDPTAKQVS